MSELIPEGATHEHKGNEEFAPHFLKVVNANKENEEVYMWLALRPEWGHWSDIPVYDKKNKDNYVKLEQGVNK